MNEIKEMANIVKQRLLYHFKNVDGGWNIPNELPFMKEFLNEVDNLCNKIKNIENESK